MHLVALDLLRSNCSRICFASSIAMSGVGGDPFLNSRIAMKPGQPGEHEEHRW